MTPLAVIQWITSCHKNRMITRVITLRCVDVTSLTTSVSKMRFLLEILSILNVIKSHFEGSFDTFDKIKHILLHQNIKGLDTNYKKKTTLNNPLPKT